MWMLLGSVVITSLLGSLHCIGMCGGFVAFYTGSDNSSGWQQNMSHLAYNGGRLITYSLLGFIVGWAGSMVDFAGTAIGLQHITAIVAGSLMVIWGIGMLSQQQGWNLLHFRLPPPIRQKVVKWQQQVRKKPPIAKAWLLGLLSTFLPCGWLYAFVITAASSSNPLKGAAVMAAFWIGTVPAMLGLGLGLHTLSVRIRRIFPWVSATAIILIGVSTLWHRSQLLVPIPSQEQSQSSSVAQEVKRVQTLHKRKPSCCQSKEKSGPLKAQKSNAQTPDSKTKIRKASGSGKK